jgi:N-acetylglucosaminyl-diphospho-decaprenol L-rhamnosyltransferase
MSPSPKITVSIVTYRSAAVIAACLDHLFTSTFLPLDVVVFDNASDDDTLARLQPYAGRVRIVANPENLGFGQGHNRALAQAVGDYFLILNPDIELSPGSLDRLARHLNEHAGCGAVAPLLAESFSDGPAG